MGIPEGEEKTEEIFEEIMPENFLELDEKHSRIPQAQVG